MNKRFSRAVTFAIIGTVVSILLRLIQICLFIDPENGFFYKGQIILGTATSAVIGITVIAAALLCRLASKIPNKYAYKSKCIAPCEIFLAIAILYEAFVAANNTSSPVWQIAVCKLLGIFAVIVLLLNALNRFINISFVKPQSNAVIAGFWLSRILVVFSAYSSVPTIADNVFELASLCMALVFYLYYAEILCGAALKPQKFFGVAVAAGMLCSIYSIPQILLSALGKGNLLHNSTASTVSDAATVIFVGVVLACFFKSRVWPHIKEKNEPDAVEYNFNE